MSENPFLDSLSTCGWQEPPTDAARKYVDQTQRAAQQLCENRTTLEAEVASHLRNGHVRGDQPFGRTA